MKNQIRKRLGRLANLEYQRRFCVQGTKSKYVLPEELLEAAANTVNTTLSSPVLSKNLRASELEALREFLAVADESASKIPFNDESVSNQELLEVNSDWRTLRNAAQRCLDALRLKASLDELL